MAKIIDNTSLKSFIDNEIYKANMALSNGTIIQDNITYSFLQCFVKLEQFIIDSYKKYAIGYKSNFNFKPKRLVKFQNELAVEKLHSKIESFITINIINYMYLDVFERGIIKNPYSNLFETTMLSDYKKMEAMRNLICHRSEKALKNFYNKCTFGAIITIEDYLTNNNCQNFLYYLTKIKDISESIVNPI